MPSLLEPQATNPEVRLRAKIVELENRIATLERQGTTVPMISGTPTGGVAGGLVGSSANRIWLNVNGTWKSVVVA